MNTQRTDETMPHSAWRWILRGHTGVFGPIACLLLLTALLASALPAQAGEKCPGGKRGFDTMTVNLYIGAGTESITALDPTDPNYLMNLVAAVTGVYYELLASQPPVRLQGVADKIVARQPDIVAVEEATLIQIESQDGASVVYDYLKILVDALKTRGAHYAVVSTSQEWDIEMPMLDLATGELEYVRQTDREAILVRTDLPPGHLRVSHPQHGNFAYVLEIPGLGLQLTRGWCSVDVFTRGENFRYICTHLEEEIAPQIQVLQAQELLDGPAKTHLPVIVVGDFNSDPLNRDGSGGFAHDTLTTAGFRDTWAVLHPFHPAGGLTWGHDEFLADPTLPFDRRIDFVFFRDAALSPSKLSRSTSS